LSGTEKWQQHHRAGAAVGTTKPQRKK